MGANTDKHIPVLVLFDAFLIGSLFFTIFLGLQTNAGDIEYDLDVAALSLEIVALGLFIGSAFSAVDGFGGHDILFFVALIMAKLGVLSMFTAAMVISYIHLIENRRGDFYYYNDPERKGAYWGSFSVSLVTGLVVPFAVFCLHYLLGKKEGSVVPQEPPVVVGDDQEPPEKVQT